MQSLHRYEEPWVFHERDLHATLREWISTWIDSFDRYMITEGSSLIMQKKFFIMIEQVESTILSGITTVVLFFFQSRNITISPSTTESYARFILKNIRSTLQKSILRHPDIDMASDKPLDDMILFGL